MMDGTASPFGAAAARGRAPGVDGTHRVRGSRCFMPPRNIAERADLVSPSRARRTLGSLDGRGRARGGDEPAARDVAERLADLVSLLLGVGRRAAQRLLLDRRRWAHDAA